MVLLSFVNYFILLLSIIYMCFVTYIHQKNQNIAQNWILHFAEVAAKLWYGQNNKRDGSK